MDHVLDGAVSTNDRRPHRFVEPPAGPPKRLGTLGTVEVGLYGGSFDPVHLGHVAVITTASATLDQVVVLVAKNSQKASAMFPVQERVRMLAGACRHLGNVQVVAHSGLLIDVAVGLGATVLVRSAGKEHGDEQRMASMNGCGGLRTVLVAVDPETAFISSSQVRALIAVGALDTVARLVPASVADVVKSSLQALK